MSIKLDSLGTGPLPDVLYVQTHSCRSGRMNLCRLDAKVAVLISCIAQAITKRIYRVIGHIEVIGTEFLEPGPFQWPAGVHMIVVEGDLSDVLGPSGAELTGWIDVAEKHIGNGMPCFAAAEPDVRADE